MMVTNYTWLAYSLKIENIDLIIINSLGTIIASTFVTLYLYVKFKVGRIHIHVMRLAIGLIFAFCVCSSLTDSWLNGLIATSMSMCQYIFILEGVKGVLQTKDPARVDLIIAFACIFNSIAWGTYAHLVGDIFVFIPNIAAFTAGCINICLYMWTTDKLKDTSCAIKFLHKCCNKQARLLPNKVKDEKEIENEGLFYCKEPEDSNSHGVIQRDHHNSGENSKNEKKEEANNSSDSDDAQKEEDGIEINLDGSAAK